MNQEFTRKLLGTAAVAIGRMYNFKDGMRIQVVGIAEDGKYSSLTEAPTLTCRAEAVFSIAV